MTFIKALPPPYSHAVGWLVVFLDQQYFALTKLIRPEKWECWGN